MKTKLPPAENELSKNLASEGYEMVNATPAKKGYVSVEANKLHPVSLDSGKKLYVPIPVTLQVKVGQNQQIAGIEGGEPKPEVAKDAEHFVKTLADNQQIEGLSSGADARPTHRIEKNEQGQEVIRRSGFSMF